MPAESLYVRKSIAALLAGHMRDMGIDISSFRFSSESTLNSLAKRCQLLYPDLNFIELRAKFGKARALSYEEKYADRSEMADERYVDFGSWEAEFRRLLFQLGLSGQLPRMKAINVGIGNGNERPSDYSAFAELTGIDVSEEALQKAKRYLPKMQTIAAEAEDLAVIPSNSQDLYVSLRTYQSSFFGIKAALFEAFRVLRPGGSIIISISNAYVESDQGGPVGPLAPPPRRPGRAHAGAPATAGQRRSAGAKSEGPLGPQSTRKFGAAADLTREPSRWPRSG